MVPATRTTSPTPSTNRIGETILDEFAVDEVSVRVSKPSAPVPHVLDTVGVTVTLRRRG